MARNPLTIPTNMALARPHLPAGVWRASEHAPAPMNTCPTHHRALDARLPGGGWPLASLIEILADSPGCGELALVTPALAALSSHRPIVLLNPPEIPNALAWQQWNVASQRLWWLRPKSLSDAWWSAQTVLRGKAFAALLAWVDPVDDKALRRLHACVQEANTLMFLFRPKTVARQFSPSPLRLLLTPMAAGCLKIEILKCKGPRPAEPITLSLAPAAQSLSGDIHVGGHRTTALAC